MPPVAAVSFLSAATAPRAPDPVGGDGNRGGDGFQAALAATAITTPVVATPVMPPALPPTAAMACAAPCSARPGTETVLSDEAATVPADRLADGAIPPPVASAGSRPAKTPPPTDAAPSLPPRPDAVAVAIAAMPGPAARTLAHVPPRSATTGTAPSPEDPSPDNPASVPAAGPAPSVPFAPTASPALPAAVIATGKRAEPTPSSAPRTVGGNGIGTWPGGDLARTVAQPDEASFPALALPAASTPTETAAAAASLHAPSPDEARHRVEAPVSDPALPPAASLVQPAAIAGRAPLAGHRALDPGSARAATIGRDVALAITRHVERGGGSTVTIRLDPVELGRIEVRLQIDPAGKLLASIAADQPAALDLLRRDTAILAQTLSQAGVQADAGSFSFDTRAGDGGRGWANPAPVRGPLDTGDESPAATAAPAAVTVRASGRINLVA